MSFHFTLQQATIPFCILWHFYSFICSTSRLVFNIYILKYYGPFFIGWFPNIIILLIFWNFTSYTSMTPNLQSSQVLLWPPPSKENKSNICCSYTHWSMFQWPSPWRKHIFLQPEVSSIVSCLDSFSWGWQRGVIKAFYISLTFKCGCTVIVPTARGRMYHGLAHGLCRQHRLGTSLWP